MPCRVQSSTFMTPLSREGTSVLNQQPAISRWLSANGQRIAAKLPGSRARIRSSLFIPNAVLIAGSAALLVALRAASVGLDRSLSWR